MLVASEEIANYVYGKYVLSAVEHGQGIVMVPVRQVWKAFDGAYKTDFIRGVLGSMKFRNAYHLSLVAAEGPSEDALDTYVFKLYNGLEAA
ncbi:MAG TPA: hypothetical protein VG204_16915 [Terriglobia bacterium]|nr:hypothetical protein [Terriglobia bacterium]